MAWFRRAHTISYYRCEVTMALSSIVSEPDIGRKSQHLYVKLQYRSITDGQTDGQNSYMNIARQALKMFKLMIMRKTTITEY